MVYLLAATACGLQCAALLHLLLQFGKFEPNFTRAVIPSPNKPRGKGPFPGTTCGDWAVGYKDAQCPKLIDHGS